MFAPNKITICLVSLPVICSRKKAALHNSKAAFLYSTNAEKSKTTFDAIKADAKKIRFELAKVIRARTVPELNFVLDDSMEYGDKMEKLFKKINEGEKSD